MSRVTRRSCPPLTIHAHYRTRRRERSGWVLVLTVAALIAVPAVIRTGGGAIERLHQVRDSLRSRPGAGAARPAPRSAVLVRSAEAAAGVASPTRPDTAPPARSAGESVRDDAAKGSAAPASSRPPGAARTADRTAGRQPATPRDPIAATLEGEAAAVGEPDTDGSAAAAAARRGVRRPGLTIAPR